MHYPDFSVPEGGQVTQVAEGVLWLRMPLPFDLNHINLYLLEDRHGWWIVDCGLGTDTARAHWEAITASLNKPIVGVIVTHMHPDHIGLAGWLCDEHRVPLYMSQTEYFAARALLNGAAGASRWQDELHFVRAGMNEDECRSLMGSGKGFGHVVSPVPVSYRRLKEGQTLTINQQQWQVMIGRGHSPEHVCLYCQERHILIAGDHILPEISPNIGAYSTEPDAGSLADYLSTLTPFLHLPQQTLVLPAHNRPFTGLHQRVHALKDHHARHLADLLEACTSPKTLKECLPVMFSRTLNPHNLGFAVAECQSHLNYLVEEEKMTRIRSTQGPDRYKTVRREIADNQQDVPSDIVAD
ncbi:MBL fold metallo-hydrolase [Alteromonas sp. CYL-A6]|uniref:MBL fold metallo-hydrolase n=1 Tax=Alteromonas nitratireducens TaxID=3390813 RepID=UPI0034B91FF7